MMTKCKASFNFCFCCWVVLTKLAHCGLVLSELAKTDEIGPETGSVAAQSHIHTFIVGVCVRSDHRWHTCTYVRV